MNDQPDAGANPATTSRNTPIAWETDTFDPAQARQARIISHPNDTRRT